MAAYAALVSLMNDLELIPNHPTHSFSFDSKQLSSLSQTVSFLVDFMETYDSHGCTTESAQVLESRIASAVHLAHDVVETHIVDQILSGLTLAGKPRSCFLFDLQRAIEGMEFMKRKAMQFKSKSGLKSEQPRYDSAPSTSSSEPLPTGNNKKKNVMVGFDADLLRLLDMLTGEPSRRQVIPIVGMGGMGKTTLATNVYNHSYAENHFDVRLWATISQEYSAETILTQLLSRNSGIGGSVSGLGEELHKMLYGRRYLVVLDDMWSVGAWDEVQMYMPDNGNGSRVVVTTRLSNLGDHLSSSRFVMSFLDNDKSWELFCGNAFREEEECPVELVDIGKKIVKRCSGLPLSIIVIGGHLRRSSRGIEYWEKVSNYMNPISSTVEGEECLRIISWSYEHLPVCLKPCFLFMGSFHEDEWVYASELHNLLVGEGFLKAKEGLSLEEVAEKYLDDLINRNLVLVRARAWNGKVEFCGIHDIVRELCLKVGKKEKFMCVLEDTTPPLDTERRFVIPKKFHNSVVFGALKSATLLRSLVRQGSGVYFDQMSVDLRSLRLLRVSSNVNHIYVKKDGMCLPAAHFQQANLRYLAFYCYHKLKSTSLSAFYCYHKLKSTSLFTERPYLPSSISLFWNMQTLAINSPSLKITAPYEIWQMQQLRHLAFHRGVYLPDPDPSERTNQGECIVLRNLHTLEGVLNFRLTEEVCRRMPSIKELSLIYNDLPGDCKASSYYCLHNLCLFDRLGSLECYFNRDSEWGDVARSLRFPSSLEKLCLRGCQLHWEDLTMMIKSLPLLGYLELSFVRGHGWDLVEEEFSRLKVLRISDCVDLTNWNASNTHFPVLEVLVIFSLPKLSEIPLDFGDIPTLRQISLTYCGVPAAISAMRIVVEQESCGNDALRLEVGFPPGTEEEESFKKMAQEEGLTTNNLHSILRPFEL